MNRPEVIVGIVVLVLGLMGLTAWVTWKLYARHNEIRGALVRLEMAADDLQGEIKSTHQRLYRSEGETEYLHTKMDKLKRMLVAAFQADGKAFMEEWRR
jgi:hypothetical protein